MMKICGKIFYRKIIIGNYWEPLMREGKLRLKKKEYGEVNYQVDA